jgi:hypothetical protein
VARWLREWLANSGLLRTHPEECHACLEALKECASLGTTVEWLISQICPMKQPIREEAFTCWALECDSEGQCTRFHALQN